MPIRWYDTAWPLCLLYAECAMSTCRRFLPLLITLACAPQATTRALRSGDVVQIEPRGGGGAAWFGTVREATPTAALILLQSGDTLRLASDSAWRVLLREGQRGPGIIGKSALIGLTVGAAPGLLAAPFESARKPENCSWICVSERQGAFIGAAFGGVGGGAIGLATGLVLAATPHWYLVPRPLSGTR